MHCNIKRLDKIKKYIYMKRLDEKKSVVINKRRNKKWTKVLTLPRKLSVGPDHDNLGPINCIWALTL